MRWPLVAIVDSRPEGSIGSIGKGSTVGMSPSRAIKGGAFDQKLLAGGMQRVGPLMGLPALIRQVGLDPAEALAGAGLAPNALVDPENRVPYAAIARLLNQTATDADIPHFGLLVGRMSRLADLGTLGELVANSPTVGDALRRLCLHQHINSESVAPLVREAAGVVDLGCLIYEGDLPIEHLCDLYLALFVNVMHELCGADWRPSAVYLPYKKPADISQYEQLFRVRPQFGVDISAIRFPAYWMQRKTLGAHPARLRIAEHRAAILGRPKTVQEVARALRVLLLTGENSGDHVARTLSLNRRTLNRRLKQEGVTFQIVLDQIRFDLARQLLAYSNISLDDVADSLGYASLTPFMRSFRRLSGMSPGHWRRTFGARERKVHASSFRARLASTSDAPSIP